MADGDKDRLQLMRVPIDLKFVTLALMIVAQFTVFVKVAWDVGQIVGSVVTTQTELKKVVEKHSTSIERIDREQSRRTSIVNRAEREQTIRRRSENGP